MTVEELIAELSDLPLSMPIRLKVTRDIGGITGLTGTIVADVQGTIVDEDHDELYLFICATSNT